MSYEIHGYCEPEFASLREAFERNFEDGLELGASLAVTLEGEMVVDLWGGHANHGRTRPWEEDTIVLVFSSTKIPAVMCALMLIDQGRLDINAPIAHYWPEFAAKGKERVLVRHVFNHSAGVPAFDPPVDFSIQYDWDAVTQRLANEAPWWEAGNQSGYHANTFGLILGELVRRVSGQSIGSFLQSEVTSKIDADFQIGMAADDFPRLAHTLEDGGRWDWGDPDSIGYRVQNCFLPPMWEGMESLTSEMPSNNGVGNGRSLAKLGAILAMNGELLGHRFLSGKTIDLVLTEQSYRRDLVIDEDIRMGFGLGLHSKEFNCIGDGSMHWGGYGGSFMIADRDRHVSIGYAMNRLLPGFNEDPRTTPIRDTFVRIAQTL